MLLSYLLFALLASFFDCVPGDVLVRQIDAGTPTESWIIKGIASYEHSGASPKLFIFQCMSTVDNGDYLQWTKVGAQLPGTLTKVTGGLELFINTPLVDTAGIYMCRDTITNEEVQFELTDSNPAARAANSSLVYYVGDTAVIEMYASAVSPFILTWKKDNKALNEGMLSSDNKTLTIPNVQLSNAGVYKITAVVPAGIFTTSTTTNTTLQVLERPFITDHPSDQMNQEWESVQFTCTAKGSLNFSISWHKVDGVVPSSSTITNDDSSNLTNTTSTLTITEVRTNDSGIYYCTASDGSRSSSSNNATLTVTDNTRLTYTSQVLSDPFLFLSEPGVIDCEGSGYHYWSGPSMTSIPSSLVGDSTIYQYTIPDTGFTRLNLTSLETFPDGLYTCLSTVNRSIYLTNDNPAVYSERHEVVVGSISNTVVLQVYVHGIDPTPSANDIEWFYNDAPLPINNDYYELQNDNKQLVISNVSSELIVGRYHINVTTTQGTQSVYINISYFDPPVVNVAPDVTEYIVDVGETVIFNCTVSSVLPISKNWYKRDGVLLDSSDGSLILSNISASDANDYYCEAVDAEGIYAIKRSITLTVRHVPVVTVETIHSGPQPSLSDAFEEGRSNSPTYYCSVSAVPSPTTVQWLFNGNTSLPMGVQQSEEISDSNNDIKYKLHWTRPVLYIDNGTFSCRALNSIGESVANVHITVYAIPHITTVYSTDLPTSIDSSIVSFTNLSSSTDSSITCIGYGLPYPSIHWVNSDGHELTNAYTFNKCGLYGTVVSSLRLTQVMTQEPVYCQVMNEIGNETQAVSITQDTNGNESSLTPTINTVTSNIVNIRLKLKMKMCIVNLESVEISLRSVLELIIQRGTQMCDPLLEISLLFNDDGCDSALILVVSIETDTTNNANNALQAISQWINTNPAIIIEGQPHQLDSNCSLIVSTQQLTSPSDDPSLFLCTPEQPTSQATPTPSTPPTIETTSTTQSDNSQMVIWLSIVGVILLLLLIVVASLVIVLYLCAKTVNRSGKGVLVGGVKPAWSDQENISMNTFRNTSMQELQTSSPFRNQLQQSNSQDNNNNGVRVGMMQDNPEYLIGPQLELLQSMTDDQIDSGPPNYQWVTDNNISRDSGYIETMRSSAVMMSQETVRSTTPFQEKLYQYGRGNEESNEDPTYAVIRPEARKHSTDQITTSLHNSNTDVHTRRYQMMPEATRRATLPSNMRYSPMRRPHQYGGPKSPAHYTKPHQHLATATTPPGGQRSVTNSSPAVNRPMPYSLPVSSTGSLRNVGLHSRPPRSGVTRPIVNRSLSTPNTIKEEPIASSAGNSPLRTVNEISNGGQQWYDGEDNSDIVTPTTPVDNYDEVDSISPYAVTPSSQIEVHPSSQPTVGSDWQLSTVTGGSSPSTIRPNQLPVVSQPFVEYQTIDV